MNIPRPEGFVVDELAGDYASGDCVHFTLKKTNWTTINAINALARVLNVNVSRFGYAGLKDKNAVTTQRVSAWRVPIARLEKIKIDGISLSDFTSGKERIRIGTHAGNKFTITILGVDFNKLREPVNVPNLFGAQRFGGSELLGKALLDGDYKGAVNLMSWGDYERRVFDYLKKNQGDYLGALRTVDKRIRVLWVNAWQAFLWNKNIDVSVPMQDLKNYDGVDGMPELGVFNGFSRATVMKVTNYKAVNLADGVKLSFMLDKGSYATTLIDFVMGHIKNELLVGDLDGD